MNCMLPKEKVVAYITFVLRCASVNVSHQAAASWVKKVSGTGSCVIF